MGHDAAEGGPDTTDPDESVVRRAASSARSPWLDLDQIIERLGLAVDRVMAEGGLWDERTAARAFRQAEGDVVEAARLVRSQRAALPRLGHARTVDAHVDLPIDGRPDDDPPPPGVDPGPVRPGSPRAARLSAMAQAETGALVQLWDQTVVDPDRQRLEAAGGEVRHGRLPVALTHPVTGEPVVIGYVRVTEVEVTEVRDHTAEDRTPFDAGYGLCLGRNERKAIAMANLDLALKRGIEHLDLTHHATFRSTMEPTAAEPMAGEPTAGDEAVAP